MIQSPPKLFKMKTCILLVMLVKVPLLTFSQNIDIDLLRQINLHRNTQLDPTFRFITNTASPVSIAAPVLVYGIGWIQKNPEIKNKGLYIAASAITASILATSTKYIVNRERPFITYPEIQKATHTGSPSFPSGHTSSAFSTATSLSMAFTKWYVILPSYLWASSVAFSRMHLGVHFPSDVLGGIIIGSGSAWICHKLNAKYFEKKTATKNKLLPVKE